MPASGGSSTPLGQPESIGVSARQAVEDVTATEYDTEVKITPAKPSMGQSREVFGTVLLAEQSAGFEDIHEDVRLLTRDKPGNDLLGEVVAELSAIRRGLEMALGTQLRG